MLEEGQGVETCAKQTSEIENTMYTAADKVNFVHGKKHSKKKSHESTEIVEEHISKSAQLPISRQEML